MTAAADPTVSVAADGDVAHPRRFGVAALASVGIAMLAYVGLVLTPTGQLLEDLALRGARQELPDVRETSLLELQGITAIGFAVATGAVILVAVSRRKPLLAVTAAAVMGVSVVGAELAKHLLPRPGLVEAFPGWPFNSFPSGHVTVAVAIGIGAMLVVPYAVRWLVAIVGAVYVIGIGQDVAVVGWHRLSDVIGATFLVLAVACAALLVLAGKGRVRQFPRRRLVGALLATLVLGAIVLTLGAIGLVFGFGQLLPLPVPPTTSDQVLAYSSTLPVGTAVIAFAFLWLIRPFGIDEPA